MNKKLIVLLSLCISILFFKNNFATTYNNVASNTTNYVTTDKTVQAAARGFVYFTNGIIFDGAVNVALPTPIIGNIIFGNGTTCKVTLEQDLIFGSIVGRDPNCIQINTTAGYAEISGLGATILFNGDTFLPACKSFSILSNVTIDGSGHDIIFSNLSTFTIQSGVTLTISNACLRGLNKLNFVGPGTLILNNTTIILDNDWTYSGNESWGTPTLTLKNNVIFSGINKQFIYASGQDMILDANASVLFDSGTTFSWASHRRNGFIMGQFGNALPGGGSRLEFNNSNFAVPSRGTNNGLYIQLPTYPGCSGLVTFNNFCNVYNDGNTNANKSLQYDTSQVYVLSGAQIDVDGYLYDNASTGYQLPTSGSTVAIKNGTAYLTYANTEAQSVDGSTRFLMSNGTSSSDIKTQFILTVINASQGSFTLTTTDGMYRVEGASSVVLVDKNATINTAASILFYDWQGHIWNTIDPTWTQVWYPLYSLSNLYIATNSNYAGWTWGTVAYWLVPSPGLLINGTGSPFHPASIANASVFTFEVI